MTYEFIIFLPLSILCYYVFGPNKTPELILIKEFLDENKGFFEIV